MRYMTRRSPLVECLRLTRLLVLFILGTHRARARILIRHPALTRRVRPMLFTVCLVLSIFGLGADHASGKCEDSRRALASYERLVTRFVLLICEGGHSPLLIQKHTNTQAHHQV